MLLLNPLRFLQNLFNKSGITPQLLIMEILCSHMPKTQFVITRDVIVKALRLPEGLSTNILYTENEMKGFLVQIGYTGDMRRMGRLVRTKLRKEWNFFFDCIGRCFTNKCSKL